MAIHIARSPAASSHFKLALPIRVGVKRPFNAPFFIRKALVRIRSTDTNLMTNDLQTPAWWLQDPNFKFICSQPR